ncbi:MAG: hypothetical protein A4E23_01351 [Methanomethylovorans sp. PtaU1.Bin073]|nr:MAG: hypothetical protein A4E23_01351 [Methanomethylovorans sp. PtaU1.Bin073]
MYSPAPFPVRAVEAIFFNATLSSGETSTVIVSRISSHFAAACLYPLVIIVGWIPLFISSSAFVSNSPVSIAAVVVPSPTSSSWVLDTSTTILAAGCSISISLRMVAPSLVITMSPNESTSILSMPLGPSVLLTAFATAFPARILMLRASLPLVL